MTTKIQENNTSVKTSLRKCLALCLKGTLVGFGGILPGVSGGTLCAAFGMYHILLDALTAPFRTLKSHGAEIVSFVLGGGLGFLGLSGAAHRIMEWNASVVICVFIGLIAGTMPALWKDAGRNGRNRFSVVSMAIGFVIILSALLVLKTGMTVNIEANPWSFLLCGVIWGLSFVVPGLSSSTFLYSLGCISRCWKEYQLFHCRFCFRWRQELRSVCFPFRDGLTGCLKNSIRLFLTSLSALLPQVRLRSFRNRHFLHGRLYWFRLYLYVWVSQSHLLLIRLHLD